MAKRAIFCGRHTPYFSKFPPFSPTYPLAFSIPVCQYVDMVCIYCGGDSKVTNSRLQKRANSVWRRRQCVECGAIWTTLERSESRSAYRVAKDESIHTFEPELLLISLYEALRHRKSAATDAAALCDTVLQQLAAQQSALITTTDIKKAAHLVLSRFDPTAAAVYLARTS